MGKHSEYFVEPQEDGGWAVKLPHAKRASAVAETQHQAIKQAKFAPEGVVHVKQQNGKFRKV
jgi:predicted RNase H-like HicB family nuclease